MSTLESKILITGANGYVGSNLAISMIDAGFQVLLTDLGPHSIVNDAIYTPCDFTVYSEVKKIIRGVDYVFFFTGRTGNSGEGFEHAIKFVEGNEITLLNLLNAIRELESKCRVIFPSTRLIYEGGSENHLKEAAKLNPKSVYAINKWACEKYLQLYYENFGVEYVIFRISLPYGTNIPLAKISYGVMSFLIDKALNGEDLKIFGDGSQKVTLVHINDLLEIMIRSIKDRIEWNRVYNIGGPDILTMKQVITSISCKFDVGVSQVEWPTVFQNADQGSLILDSESILNTLDYSFKFSFNEWLNQLEP